MEPATSRDQLVSAFVQDQVAIGDALHLTLGTKLEHNDFSGFEIQPSARATWEFSLGHTLWGAVSRAVRVPTRLERDIAIDVSDPDGDPVIRLLGNPSFGSEKLVAYELGYRWQAWQRLSFDLAAFHNQYHDLASLEVGNPFIDPRDRRTVIPIVNENRTDGRARGFEALVTFAPLSSWRLSGSYSHLSLSLDPHGQDLNRGKFIEGSTPRDQFGMQSLLDLPGGWQLDAQFRSLSAIRSIPSIVSGEGIPGYAELDVRLGWRSRTRLEISLIGQNLLHARHPEFNASEARGDVERSVFGKIAWGF